MIVADTNLLVYLCIAGDRTAAARDVFQKDPDWAAPQIWRSEFVNVLGLHIQHRGLAPSQALALLGKAERIVSAREFASDWSRVLDLAAKSKCTTYDGEYVALAQQLDVVLVTSDREILAAFPDVARSIEDFASSSPTRKE